MTLQGRTHDDTLSGDRGRDPTTAKPRPGLLLVFSVNGPELAAMPLDRTGLEVGRSMLPASAREDSKVSRQHIVVTFADGRWAIKDLGSHNGTFVDGQRIHGTWEGGGQPVVRMGGSVFLLLNDVSSFEDARIETEADVVVGPTLRRTWQAIARAARAGKVVHLTGETGTGKEVAARHFHASGVQRSGSLVAINCAAIPATLAERLLFGAKRGAFSGAEADVEGYLQSADGGTLFLDEVGELELAVQAKLLRVLETKEVLALGASRGRKVEFALCSATLAALEQRVAQGTFRNDLYFRIASPSIEVPALRHRREEIPWLISSALRGTPLRMHVSLVEEALVRPWRGNVRELLSAVRTAAGLAEAEGQPALRGSALPRPALTALSPALDGLPVPTSGPRSVRSREEVLTALERSGNNVSATARALGLHRTQLRRLLSNWRSPSG